VTQEKGEADMANGSLSHGEEVEDVLASINSIWGGYMSDGVWYLLRA